jgi:hypothetical protein
VKGKSDSNICIATELFYICLRYVNVTEYLNKILYIYCLNKRRVVNYLCSVIIYMSIGFLVIMKI